METESDGFRVAELDLALRGRGEILGARQHGAAEFRIARLPEDAALLEAAHGDAREIAEPTAAAPPERPAAASSPARPDPAAELLIAAAEERFGRVHTEAIAP